MTFTGPVAESLPAGTASSSAVTFESGAPRTSSPPRPFRRAVARASVDDADAEQAIARTAAWLLDHQAADGHWRAPLEGDTILESEYLLLLAWAGRLDDHRVRGAADRILAEQLPDGGWAIYPGGPVDVQCSNCSLLVQ